jgi:four helix bundle protein
MEPGDSFRDLRVWQEALALRREVWGLVRAWPCRYADLADQMRRASRSVHSNIAEGNGESSRRDYVRLLHDARGSLQDLESDVTGLEGSDLLPPEIHASLTTRIANTGRLLAALIRSLEPPP